MVGAKLEKDRGVRGLDQVVQFFAGTFAFSRVAVYDHLESIVWQLEHAKKKYAVTRM
jgi:hypothetical protein